jgi:phage tail protein X
MATTYYWTSEPEDPAVYHTNPGCAAGQQILRKNKVTASLRPNGRRLCEEC